YLQQYPALREERTHALELVYRELLLREELGEAPQPAEYQQRFPPLASQLAALIEFGPVFASAHGSFGPSAATIAAPPPQPPPLPVAPAPARAAPARLRDRGRARPRRHGRRLQGAAAGAEPPGGAEGHPGRRARPARGGRPLPDRGAGRRPPAPRQHRHR